jgi:hypothetical protein
MRVSPDANQVYPPVRLDYESHLRGSRHDDVTDQLTRMAGDRSGRLLVQARAQ